MSEHLFKDGTRPNWYIRFWHNGKKIVKSSGSTDRKKAERFYEKEVGKARHEGAGYVGPMENRVTFEDLVELIERDYRIKGKRSLGSASVDADGKTVYKGALHVRFRHLRPFFGKYKMADVTTAVIEQYIDVRAAEFRMVGPRDAKVQKMTSKASIGLELAALKRMFQLAVDRQMLSRAPAFPPPLQKPNDNRRRGFTDEATFNACRDHMPEDLRDPLTFLYLSAWRPGEMRTLQWKDVDFAESMIELRPEHSKNGEPRLLPLDDPELLAVVLRAKAVRRLECPFVFHREGRGLSVSMFRKRWVKATAAAGVPGLLIYDLRRSGIRNLVRSGVGTRVAMSISGHRTESTFARYNITDVTDLRAAVAKQRVFLDAQSKTRKVVPISEAAGQLALVGAK